MYFGHTCNYNNATYFTGKGIALCGASVYFAQGSKILDHFDIESLVENLWGDKRKFKFSYNLKFERDQCTTKGNITLFISYLYVTWYNEYQNDLLTQKCNPPK